MLFPELEKKLRDARLVLDAATSENVVDLCKQYLALLAEYRAELYRLPKTLDLHPRSRSSISREDLDATRKAIRTAIEHTTQERGAVEALLFSFTTISGYGAVETLNRRKYKDHNDWRLSASGVSLRGDTSSVKMTMQEAVDVASLLRREEYVARNAAAARARDNTSGYSRPRANPAEAMRDDRL